jgi:hypothetical protein
MRNTILIAVISLLMIGCNKDKISTKPQLTFKSFNTSDLYPGQILEMKVSFTDSEGDIVDSSLYVEQFSINCRNTSFKNVYLIPAFPTSTNLKGEFLISFGYRANGFPPLKEPQCNNVNDDTCFFRFALRDKAKNVSDTIVSDAVIIHR